MPGGSCVSRGLELGRAPCIRGCDPGGSTRAGWRADILESLVTSNLPRHRTSIASHARETRFPDLRASPGATGAARSGSLPTGVLLPPSTPLVSAFQPPDSGQFKLLREITGVTIP